MQLKVMHLKQLSIFNFILTICAHDVCIGQKTCADCMVASRSCAWCKDSAYPYERCQLSENHSKNRCQSFENIQTSIRALNKVVGDSYRIENGNKVVSYRRGDDIKISVPASFVAQPGIDLFFVVERTKHLKPIIDSIKEGIKNFSRDEKNNAKIGFLTYFDKIIYPNILYSDKSLEYIQYKIPFNKHQTEYVQSGIANISLYNILTGYNAGLDAIAFAVYQSAKIGFRHFYADRVPFMIFIANNRVKSMGDGKIAGLFKPFDFRYWDLVNTDGSSFDYISVGKLGKLLRHKNWALIILVPANLVSYYRKLTKIWKGVRVIIIAIDINHFNFYKFYKERMQKELETLYLNMIPTDVAEVTIKTKCSTNGPVQEKNFCENVKIGEQISFELSIKMLKSPKKAELLFSMNSMIPIKIDLELIDQCPCDKVEVSQKIGKPPFQVSIKCGQFICPTNKMGHECQCDKNLNQNQNNQIKCIDEKTNLLCSRKGLCDECGTCFCWMKSPKSRYTGEKCEVSELMCPKIDNRICGGSSQGTCENDHCVCKPGYTGLSCEKKDCQHEDILLMCKTQKDQPDCSNNGNCFCGICLCHEGFTGKHCNTPIVATCKQFISAVSCHLYKENYDENKPCQPTSNTFIKTRDGKYNCDFVNTNGCKIFFSFQRTLDGTNYEINIKQFDQNTDCFKPLSLTAIFGISFGSICGFFLLIFTLTVFVKFLYWKNELKNFTKEIAASPTKQNASPLYKYDESVVLKVKNENFSTNSAN